MREFVLGLGSNLGDSTRILQGAVDDLSGIEGIDITEASAVFETEPVGGPEQPMFMNAVVTGRTSLLEHELLSTTQGVEEHWHRTREVRWGPRTLDIDIIAMGDTIVDEPDLVIPHPRAHERAFVLVPWHDVDPDASLVGHGSVVELLTTVDASGVRRTDAVISVPRAD